jgi:hypothetical protein
MSQLTAACCGLLCDDLAIIAGKGIEPWEEIG